MGRWLKPCCCICGDTPETWEDRRWYYQDFCPKHSNYMDRTRSQLAEIEVWINDPLPLPGAKYHVGIRVNGTLFPCIGSSSKSKRAAKARAIVHLKQLIKKIVDTPA